MYEILAKEDLAPVTKLFDVHAPAVAEKARAGQFVIIRLHEEGGLEEVAAGRPIQPLAAVVFVWDGVFLGLADFAFLAGAMFLSALVTCGLLLAVLPLGWPLAGVWWAMIVLIVTRIGT